MAQGRSDTSKLRIFNRARWHKTSRYTVSGLVVIVIGGLLTAYGLIFSNGNYGSVEGLVLGAGAIIVLIGIIRLLIGFINPSIPEELDQVEEHGEEVVDPIFPEQE